MKLKVQHSLRSLLVFIGVVCVIFAVVYSDRFLWVSSSATETPVSWMRNSSSMKSDFEYLWNNKHDPNIDRSEAVKNLRLLVSQEVPPESPASDIKKHIERHYRNPSFAFSGFLNDCWTQNAHGHPTVLYSGHKLVTVNYYVRNDKLFYVGVSLGIHGGYIDLTEPVDFYDFSSSSSGD